MVDVELRPWRLLTALLTSVAITFEDDLANLLPVPLLVK